MKAMTFRIGGRHRITAVRFGSPGWDDVPISRAIQASAALPGLYPPNAQTQARYDDWVRRQPADPA